MVTKKKAEVPDAVSELAEAILDAAPDLAEIVEEALALYDAPGHIGGTSDHYSDEAKLDSLALKLGETKYPDKVRPKLIELFDQVRRSLAT